MRFFFVLIACIFLYQTSFSQEFNYKILAFESPDNEYNTCQIEDSLILTESSDEIVRRWAPNEINRVWSKGHYSNHQTFNYADGRKIRIHFYPDSRIFFQAHDSLQKLLMEGELIIDTIHKISTLSEIPLTDEYGDWLVDSEGSYVYPENVYVQLVPNGEWSFYSGDLKWTEVNYKNGLKDGISRTVLSGYCYTSDLVISEKIFHQGQLVSATSFDSSSSKERLEKIMGHWYHPYCHDFTSREYDVWVFTREKMDNGPRNGLSCSNFLVKNRYEWTKNYSCSLDVPTTEAHSPSKWQYNADGTIQIEEQKFNIVYLDDKYMLLKMVKK